MKKLILIVETITGLLCFLLFSKIDLMFALCILVFSSIYLFGIVDFRKNPQRMDAHLMVGGMMFFIAMCFVILNNLSNIQFPIPFLLIVIMGLVGILQALILKSRFK